MGVGNHGLPYHALPLLCKEANVVMCLCGFEHMTF